MSERHAGSSVPSWAPEDGTGDLGQNGGMSLGQFTPRPGDAVTGAMVAGLVGVAPELVEFVWRNDNGGLTFRYRAARQDQPTYLTWLPARLRGLGEKARARAAWVAPYVPVPVFSELREGLGGVWMTSAALPGDSAVGPWGKAHPEAAVRAIATGLRRLHDGAPAASCPFTWDIRARADAVRCAVATGGCWRQAPDDYLASWSTKRAYEVLTRGCALAPDPVVCHGDPCAPNTVLSPATGAFVGLVDLGDLGVADRWADLAIASWSLGWNYGPGWEPLFFDTYGAVPDPRRIAFYRLLGAAPTG